MNFGLLELAGKWIGLTVISVMSLFNGDAYIEKELSVNNNNVTKDVYVTSVITPYQTITKYNNKLPNNVTITLVEGQEGIKYVVPGSQEQVIQEKVDKVVEKGTAAVGTYTGRLSGYGPDCAGCSGTGGLACRTKNGGRHSLYFSLSDYNVYEGSKETITVKYPDVAEHKYNFYGYRNISFTLGTNNESPSVVIS